MKVKIYAVRKAGKISGWKYLVTEQKKKTKRVSISYPTREDAIQAVQDDPLIPDSLAIKGKKIYERVK